MIVDRSSDSASHRLEGESAELSPVLSNQDALGDLPGTFTRTDPANSALVTPTAVSRVQGAPVSSTADFLGLTRPSADLAPEADSLPAVGSGLFSLALLGCGVVMLTRSKRPAKQG
jgi:hypothetical protein